MASSILACNIQAISGAQRPRYDDLVSRLRTAMRDRKELPDGYRYSFDSAKITLPEVSEWISLEHLCCPFLIFQLEGAGELSHVSMRGLEGVKAILQQEFQSGKSFRRGRVMDKLTIFGLFSVTAMLATYALEKRSHWFSLAFAVSCVLRSAYGFLQGALGPSAWWRRLVAGRGQQKAFIPDRQ